MTAQSPLAGRELMAAFLLRMAERVRALDAGEEFDDSLSLEQWWFIRLGEEEEDIALEEADALIALLTGEEAVERMARRHYEQQVWRQRLPKWSLLSDENRASRCRLSLEDARALLGIEGDGR